MDTLHNGFFTIRFPNSSVEFRFDKPLITVQGWRGSIEDMILPLLIKLGIELDMDWYVDTTRPDVVWYRRTVLICRRCYRKVSFTEYVEESRKCMACH